MEFHAKHKTIPANLETGDEALDKETGSDVAKMLDMIQELMDYWDAGLKMQDTDVNEPPCLTVVPVLCSWEVLRQLDANGATSSTAAGQCRLTPLIPLLLDCSLLFHFSVLALFKLHGREAPLFIDDDVIINP
ncbi:Huntingtin-interacting protein 1-related protein [Liparis tanakae]|uniref:Huntingtin-interacting protein 1-related protein n=1 Tax=Liparis tanakae TaxID=230148 RepID=A0A4Z2EBD0_9TELE|nr:Huntingtin-interacting protein 1-related protein [Liparis tanakae]